MSGSENDAQEDVPMETVSFPPTIIYYLYLKDTNETEETEPKSEQKVEDEEMEDEQG